MYIYIGYTQVYGRRRVHNRHTLGILRSKSDDLVKRRAREGEKKKVAPV